MAIRKRLTSLASLLLGAVVTASAGSNPATAAPPADVVRIGGGYPVAVVKIPVEDPATKHVPAALFEPEGAGPFPAVILLSGCSGVGPDFETMRRVTTSYVAKGIATLVVDSFTPRGVLGVCDNPTSDTVEYRSRDAIAASVWLSRRAEIDARKIFLQGYSHGAIAAIAVINTKQPPVRPHKIRGVVAFYPFCFPDTKFSVPTVILVGEKDDWTPADRCEAITDKTNVEVVVYPDALHAFAMPGLDMVYLGHRVAYQEAAAVGGQRRALALIESLIK
jgi:dienelactone hydrolase